MNIEKCPYCNTIPSILHFHDETYGTHTWEFKCECMDETASFSVQRNIMITGVSKKSQAISKYNEFIYNLLEVMKHKADATKDKMDNAKRIAQEIKEREESMCDPIKCLEI